MQQMCERILSDLEAPLDIAIFHTDLPNAFELCLVPVIHRRMSLQGHSHSVVSLKGQAWAHVNLIDRNPKGDSVGVSGHNLLGVVQEWV